MNEITSDLFNNFHLLSDSQMIGEPLYQVNYNHSWEHSIWESLNINNEPIFENNQFSQDSTGFISNQQNICQHQSFPNAKAIVEDKQEFQPNLLKRKRIRGQKQLENQDKNDRKEKSDGINKKIKVDFLDFMNENLGKMYNYQFPNENIKFNKLNQKTITKININFNSQFLRKSPYQIYFEDRNRSKGDVDELKNSKLIKKLYEIKENKSLLDAPLYSFFKNSYLNSDNYDQIINLLRKKENESYVEKFKKLSENFVSYFLETKKNEKKSSPK